MSEVEDLRGASSVVRAICGAAGTAARKESDAHDNTAEMTSKSTSSNADFRRATSSGSNGT